jgi:hypothetical protein
VEVPYAYGELGLRRVRRRGRWRAGLPWGPPPGSSSLRCAEGAPSPEREGNVKRRSLVYLFEPIPVDRRARSHAMTMVRLFAKPLVALLPILAAAAWSRLGHADAPPGRYTIQSATVYDTKTKLTWQQDVAPSTYTWSAAQSYCTGLNLNGTGWRLPSVKELLTVVDETRTSPAIDSAAFPNTPVAAFWTSSPLAGDPSSAWYVSFGYGNTGTAAVTSTNQVRCVR